MSQSPSRSETRWPTGTVTFLFTDIEGSSAAQERYPEAMLAAVMRHDALAAGIIAGYNGILVKDQGRGGQSLRGLRPRVRCGRGGRGAATCFPCRTLAGASPPLRSHGAALRRSGDA